MTRTATGPLLAGLVLLLLGPSTGAVADDELPSAARVVVRGKRDLADALRVTLVRPGPGPGVPGPVLLVLDVTPYVAAAEDALAAALAALDGEGASRWRVARLGEEPLPPVEGAGRLVPLLGTLLAEDTDVPATIPALERTVRGLPERGATVVYLADWHFEDDVRLEPFLALLRKREHVFHVVGSEACFNSAWSDGFYPPDRGTRGPDGASKLYADGVGRNPFGSEDVAAPWHGGDVAWPHLPWRFRGTHWVTRFPVEIAPPPPRRSPDARDRYGGANGEGGRVGKGSPEDLQDRRREAQDEEALERSWFPLPSGFGSYPLMRLGAETGGRYVLFSWNPSGRSDVTYDYTRLNLFAPDLRARKTIHDEVRSRPLALAMVQAWHEVANAKVRVADVTPPLGPDGRRPLEIQEAAGVNCLDFSWHTKRDWRVFQVVAARHLASVEKAIARLDLALRVPVTDGPDRRYHADALLFRHVLQVKAFQLREAIAAAQVVPAGAWDDTEHQIPVLEPETYLRPESDPEMVIPEDVEVADSEGAERVTRLRREHVERFQGTPYGEMVARNPVVTYRVEMRPLGSGSPARESPAESDGSGPATPPTPRSGGGGPVTGR